MGVMCMFAEGMSMTHMASARSTPLDGVVSLSRPRREMCEWECASAHQISHGRGSRDDILQYSLVLLLAESDDEYVKRKNILNEDNYILYWGPLYGLYVVW